MDNVSFDAGVLDFGESIGMLLRRMRAAAVSEDLSWSEAAVLKRIAVEGPSSIADLARIQGMKPQSMGTIVSSLEEMGMVERHPHPDDRRSMFISLTEKGAAAHQAIGEAKPTWLAEAIGRLDEPDQATLFASARVLRHMLALSGSTGK